MRCTFFLLSTLLFAAGSIAQTGTSLSGAYDLESQHFVFTDSFHFNDTIRVAVNPAYLADQTGQVYLYLTANRNESEWATQTSLEDLRGGGPQLIDLGGDEASDFIFIVENTEGLDDFDGIRPSQAYDLVVDVDMDGQLSAGDIIDGWQADGGIYLLPDVGEAGPFEVVTTEYSEDFWHTMRVYYPLGISGLDAVPLVVVAHGWTHEYTYYDHIGEHLASYGYVVIAHRNDVGSGNTQATETASQTTLENMDVFIGALGEIAGGVLEGKVDHSRTVLCGHSTGGECVVRAYHRLLYNDFESEFFEASDIRLVISLAPVSWMSGDMVHPEGVNYHQFLCGADTDVSGAANDNYVQALAIYERGYGNKSVLHIHGAGHNDLFGVDGSSWASGPDLIGREATHTAQLPYTLALCELYTYDSNAFKPYFTRNSNVFRPPGVAENVVLSNEYRDALSAVEVIDDFQMEPGLETASSGIAVSSEGLIMEEILMQDHDGSYSWEGDFSNGMARSRYDDDPRCVAFTWENEAHLTYHLDGELTNWHSFENFSFRAAQLTSHPFNGETISFEVQFRDAGGNETTVPVAAYGTLNEPYQRGVGQGGYLQLCLEDGVYTIDVSGSNWEEEMFFTIPGYFDYQPAGEYEMIIEGGDPCTDIEVLMYDTWGDGWDAGMLTIYDSEGTIVAQGTLSDGTEPSTAEGWQNEFYIYTIDLDDLRFAEGEMDLNQMLEFSFRFAEGGTPEGAIAIDDIALTRNDINDPVAIGEEIEVDLAVWPQPSSGMIRIDWGLSDVQSLMLFDMQGRQVWRLDNVQQSNESFQADLHELESGSYLLLLVDPMGRRLGSTKVLLQK